MKVDAIFGLGGGGLSWKHWQHIVGPAIFLGLLFLLLFLFFLRQSMWCSQKSFLRKKLVTCKIANRSQNVVR